MSEQFNILILDDRVTLALSHLNRAFQLLNANIEADHGEKTVRISDEEFVSVLSKKVRIPWEFGEYIEVTLDALGKDKDELLAGVQSAEFLKNYHAILVDRQWTELSFGPSDFGLYSAEFNQDENNKDINAGFFLKKFMYAHCEHEPIIALFSSHPASPKHIIEAIREGAHQFIDKSNTDQLLNLFAFIFHSKQRPIPLASLGQEGGQGVNASIESLNDEINRILGTSVAQKKLWKTIYNNYPNGYDPQALCEMVSLPTITALETQLNGLTKHTQIFGWELLTQGEVRLQAIK